MTWMDQLRFGVAKVLLKGVEFPWRGRLNFGDGFVATDNPTLKATDIAFELASGAATGDIAVASSGSPKTWTASPPATVLRTGYDSKLSNITLDHDAGETWQDLWVIARTTLVPVDEGCIDFALKFTVKDNHGLTANTKDKVTIRAEYRRHDYHLDSAKNVDDGSASRIASPTISWTLPLQVAALAGGGPLFEVRLLRSGDNILIQARRHQTIDRRLWAELHLGNVD